MPRNPLGLKKRERERLVAFHEAGHAVVAATYGRTVVDVDVAGATPHVSLSRASDDFVGELAVLCAGFTAVELSHPHRSAEFHQDGAQADMRDAEELTTGFLRFASQEGSEATVRLVEHLNWLAAMHPAFAPERFTIPVGEITDGFSRSNLRDGVNERLTMLCVFVGRAEARARLSSKAGRNALHEAAHYLLSSGSATPTGLNARISRKLNGTIQSPGDGTKA